MIAAAILAAVAAFLGWLAFATPHPVLTVLFAIGAVGAAGWAVLWYLDTRAQRAVR